MRRARGYADAMLDTQAQHDPSTPPTFRYDAFISYRHVEPDRGWAKWLHGALETYRVPKELVKKGIPARLTRVFRDEEELPANADLSTQITTALNQSKFLIVVCSPRAVESRWVNAEVEHFRALGRHDKILALLIEGEPRTSFPKALVEIRRTVVEHAADGAATTREVIEDVEPLAADVRPERGDEKAHVLRGHARLRMLACILGCRFDDLRQREAERRARRRAQWTMALGAAAIGAGALSVYAFSQRNDALFAMGVATQREAEARQSAEYALQQRRAAEAARAAEEAAKKAALADRDLARDRLRDMLRSQSDQERANERPHHAASYLAMAMEAGLDDPSTRLELGWLLDQAERERPQLVGHADIINEFALSPDGHRAISCSNDGSVLLWALSDGRILGRFGGAELSGVNQSEDICVWTSDNGLALACGDRFAEVIDAEAARTVARIAHAADITAAALAGTAQRAVAVLASKAERGLLLIAYDARAKTEMWRVESASRFSATEQHVFVLGMDGRLQQLNAFSGEPVWASSPGQSVSSWASDGETLLVAFVGGRVERRSLSDPQRTLASRSIGQEIQDMALRGSKAALARTAGVELIDANSLASQAEVPGTGGTLLQWNDRADRLLAWQRTGGFTIWQISPLMRLAASSFASKRVTMTADGEALLASGFGSKVIAHTAVRAPPIEDVQLQGISGGRPGALSSLGAAGIDADGRIVTRLWNEDRPRIGTAVAPAGGTAGIRFSELSGTLAVGLGQLAAPAGAPGPALLDARTGATVWRPASGYADGLWCRPDRAKWIVQQHPVINADSPDETLALISANPAEPVVPMSLDPMLRIGGMWSISRVEWTTNNTAIIIELNQSDARVGEPDRLLVAYQPTTGRAIKTWWPLDARDSWVVGMDGALLISEQNGVAIHRLDQAVPTRIAIGVGPIKALSVAPNRQSFAALTAGDRRVHIVPSSRGDPVISDPLELDSAGQLAWSADSAWIAATGTGGVLVFNAKNGRLLFAAPVDGMVRSLAWRPDNRGLILETSMPDAALMINLPYDNRPVDNLAASVLAMTRLEWANGTLRPIRATP